MVDGAPLAGGPGVVTVVESRRKPRLLVGSYVVAAVILAAAFWVLESMIHVVIFREGDFRSQLFTLDPHEIWKRLLFAAMVIVASGPQGVVPGAFDGPVSGGGLSSSKPGGASRRSIRRGEPVLVDMAACSHGYLADQTRVFCLGSLPKPLSRAHSFCLRVMDRLLREGVPGRESQELYDLALGMAEQEGWEQVFMGAGEAKVPFVGHGVGLELDEWPILSRGSGTRLEEGMVVAVEPKVGIPGRGTVGVEDTCVVTGQGLEPLTWGERDVVCR